MIPSHARFGVTMKIRTFRMRAAGLALAAFSSQLFPASSQAAHAPREVKRGSAESTAVGRIAIGRIGLDAPVLEGTTQEILKKGVGHFTKTPQPGGAGNVALAAHRDTFFFPLRYIRVGDEITLTNAEGAHRYRVEKTWVVKPKNIEVLDPTEAPSLTLVTCYPFNLRGVNAPERFIVRARRIEATDAPQVAQLERAKDF